MAANNEHIEIFINNTMRVLNELPEMDSFLGILDLKTGSIIISALCMLHPTVYGCTFFMPMSYLILTIWFLLTLFFTASVLLFYGLTNNDILLISTWIWYSLLFVVAMFLLLFLMALFFILKKQNVKVIFVALGVLWYILTIYFILVVNSHRKALIDANVTHKTENSSQIPRTIESLANLSLSELEQFSVTLDTSDETVSQIVRDRLKGFRKVSLIDKPKP